MKLTKTNPILRLVNDFVIDSPAPSNINYLWNFGSLLGLNLILMILTGIALAMYVCGCKIFKVLSVLYFII